MATSLNGWPVLKPSSPLLVRKRVPGTKRDITMRAVAIRIFLALAHDYDEWLREIDVGAFDDAGYAYRQARMANDFSNHASGTALDINWSKEGAQNSNAGKAFFAKSENKRKVEWLKEVYQILDWGGDWRAKDYMHWELRPGTTLNDVRRVVKHLGIDANGVRHNGPNGKPLEVPRK